MPIHPRNLAFVAFFLLLPGPLVWAGGTAEGSEDEKFLQQAGLRTDGPALLKYFRDRSPNDAERARLAELVGKLGDNAFRVREKSARELIAAGEAALPFLKAALKDQNLEMLRRAEACIRTIERVPYVQRTGAAARLLAARRPQNGVEALLGYLPFADWEMVEEDLLQALTMLGLEGTAEKCVPAPAIVEAVKDKNPRRRLAAAHVLGQSGAAHREALGVLARDDDLLVRFHAGAALVRCRDSKGIPPLLGLLGEAPLPLAWRAEDVLSRIAGEKGPQVPQKLDEAAVRRKWQGDWEAWWKTNRDTIDLARVKLEGTFAGLTLVCEMDAVGQSTGRVSAFQRGKTPLWNIEGLESPTDVQGLPGGRVLVAEHWGQRVTERDRAGKVLREWRFENKPVTCRRLANGNTFIATYTEIVEMSPAGTKVFSYTHQGMIYCACPLPNQHVLFINSGGQVVEVDRAGTQVRMFSPKSYADGAAYWASVEPLPNGRYLIALGGRGKVIETDATGAIHWEASVDRACSATMLRNGNILAASADGRFVVEIDRAQREVWRGTTKGRPFWGRRY